MYRKYDIFEKDQLPPKLIIYRALEILSNERKYVEKSVEVKKQALEPRPSAAFGQPFTCRRRCPPLESVAAPDVLVLLRLDKIT
jgi:hypothetical protein